MTNRSAIVIPARYESSRYPGKPLVPLIGKPMVIWVAELSAKAFGREAVYVATDDSRISNVVEHAGFKAIMTEPDALTGTDRLAEAAEKIDADIFINVQGDEPTLDPADILLVDKVKRQHPHAVVNSYCYLSDDEDPSNVNIPKVVTNEKDELVYMSRAGIPGSKTAGQAPERYKKQVCIYAFTLEELRAFAAFGRKSLLERHEDIEILRFIELGIPIQMVQSSGGSVAVDVEEDVPLAEAAIRRKFQL